MAPFWGRHGRMSLYYPAAIASFSSPAFRTQVASVWLVPWLLIGLRPNTNCFWADSRLSEIRV